MRSFTKTVVLTGLFVGVSDLTAAYFTQFIRTGKFAGKMLHYIAGGALGLEASMQGGLGTALLGLFIHFFIAMSFTLLFFLAFPRLKFLSSVNKYLVGLLYGVFVGATMTFIILPLTRLPDSPFVFERAIVGWGVLALALGLPIAISAYRYYGERRPGN